MDTDGESAMIRKGDRVRKKDDLGKSGVVRRLSHKATKAHVKWDFIDEGVLSQRRTIEDAVDLEIIEARKRRQRG